MNWFSKLLIFLIVCLLWVDDKYNVLFNVLVNWLVVLFVIDGLVRIVVLFFLRFKIDWSEISVFFRLFRIKNLFLVFVFFFLVVLVFFLIFFIFLSNFLILFFIIFLLLLLIMLLSGIMYFDNLVNVF